MNINIKNLTPNELSHVNKLVKKREKLYRELKAFNNITRARRIRINIMLDSIALQYDKIYYKYN